MYVIRLYFSRSILYKEGNELDITFATFHEEFVLMFKAYRIGPLCKVTTVGGVE